MSPQRQPNRGQATVELALALYRDPRIVKELISSLALENNSDRVALAMTEDAKGPWLIVSADGGFVTCLGRGHRVSPHQNRMRPKHVRRQPNPRRHGDRAEGCSAREIHLCASTTIPRFTMAGAHRTNRWQALATSVRRASIVQAIPGVAPNARAKRSGQNWENTFQWMFTSVDTFSRQSRWHTPRQIHQLPNYIREHSGKKLLNF